MVLLIHVAYSTWLENAVVVIDDSLMKCREQKPASDMCEEYGSRRHIFACI